MWFLTSLLLSLWMDCCFVHADESFTFPVYRKSADSGTGIIASRLDRSLYWYGNFTIGDVQLKLLIDTGSTDIVINPGLYKPSKYASKFTGHRKFSISYEGVNRLGYGFSTLKGNVVRDVVSSGGLTIMNQSIGLVTSFKYIDVKPLPYPEQNQGLIGFGARLGSSFEPETNSWFYSLCKQQKISECRLGLAYGVEGEGVTVVGKLADELIDGPLTVSPALGPFSLFGDVTLNGKVIEKDQLIDMDVGTDNIQGPNGPTKKIFDLLGYKTVELTGPNLFAPKHPTKNLLAFFPCDKPPTLGFAFPTERQLKKGQKQTVFNVSPDVWNVYDHGNNNCTSILGGQNAIENYKTGKGEWLLGQSFFAGHYIDFNIDAKTISFGNLKNPKNPSA